MSERGRTRRTRANEANEGLLLLTDVSIADMTMQRATVE
jgi:hypothetical protein